MKGSFSNDCLISRQSCLYHRLSTAFVVFARVPWSVWRTIVVLSCCHCVVKFISVFRRRGVRPSSNPLDTCVSFSHRLLLTQRFKTTFGWENKHLKIYNHTNRIEYYKVFTNYSPFKTNLNDKNKFNKSNKYY